MSNMLQTKTAEEILTTVFKPKEFIIDGLLTQGLYVLAGAQKVGKSWLAMDLSQHCNRSSCSRARYYSRNCAVLVLGR